MRREKTWVITTFTAVILMMSVVSCDPSKKLQKQEDDEIQSYLTENPNLNFVRQASGLYYLEVVAGTGLSPVVSDSVYVNYTGKFLDGTIFDSNSIDGVPYGFIVGESIVGFDEGIRLMKAGGKSTLLIPSNLAYGTSGTNGISGFTPLLFDVQLLKVVKNTGK